MTSLIFSRWRPLTARINFWFRLGLCTCPQKARMSKCTKFRKDLKPWLNYNYFRVGKTNGCHIEILLPVSILTCQSSSACNSASVFQILCESVISGVVMTSLKLSRWRPLTSRINFRFQFLWCACPQKVRISKCTKFGKDISIYGWVITTSGFEKRTAAILKFYFRFQLWPISRHRHLILHRHSKFRLNRTIGGLATTLC